MKNNGSVVLPAASSKNGDSVSSLLKQENNSSVVLPAARSKKTATPCRRNLKKENNRLVARRSRATNQSNHST
jgi:hypothetical protein